MTVATTKTKTRQIHWRVRDDLLRRFDQEATSKGFPAPGAFFTWLLINRYYSEGAAKQAKK